MEGISTTRVGPRPEETRILGPGPMSKDQGMGPGVGTLEGPLRAETRVGGQGQGQGARTRGGDQERGTLEGTSRVWTRSEDQGWGPRPGTQTRGHEVGTWNVGPGPWPPRGGGEDLQLYAVEQGSRVGTQSGRMGQWGARQNRSGTGRGIMEKFVQKLFLQFRVTGLDRELTGAAPTHLAHPLRKNPARVKQDAPVTERGR